MTLLPTDDGCRVSLGACGTGKSYGIRRDVLRVAADRSFPVMVLDLTGEWKQAPRGSVLAPSVTDAARALDAGAPLAVVRIDSLDDAAAIADEAFAWACAQRDKDPDGKGACAGVVVNEAQLVWPAGARLRAWTYRAISQWRHYRVAVWLDVQRVAELQITLSQLARETRLYATGAPTDLERFRAWGGQPLLDALADATRRWRDGGGARGTGQGWHVTLDESRMGPYKVER